MSKIARVKFIRDKEPNIKALTAKNKVLDGALYVATDTGTMWMGISATSLIQIKDNINTNTTYTLTKSGSTITLKGSDGSSVNITDSNTIYNNATASAAGLMSAADKSKLDSVATGANKTVVDASFVDNSTNPVQSKVVKSALDGKSNTGHKHVKADITDFPTSMPASDVPTWAKAATKPSYSKSEVGLGNVNNTADANKSVKYATSAGSASTATTVVNGGAASADVARHVWFSDSSNETARVSNDNFKYNPNGNLLTTNISGNAATASSVTWGNVSGKPSAFTPASHTHDDRYYTESEINSKLNGKANSSHTHTKSQISDFPSKLEPYFADNTWYVVGNDAAIGDHNKGGAFCVKGLKGTPNISLYNSDDSYYGQCITTADIGSQSVSHAKTAGSVAWTNVSGRPSIPSVGNGTITITQNGATKGSFTLNQSGNATIALTDNNTNTWRPEEVIISSTKPSASTCKLWIKI